MTAGKHADAADGPTVDHCSCGFDALAELTERVSRAADPREARGLFLGFTLHRLTAPWGGLTRRRDSEGARFVMCSGPVVADIARAVQACRQGLSWQAVQNEAVIVANDLITETRWPQLVPVLARRVPVRSAMAVPMHLDEDSRGALMLYSDEVGHFDDTRVRDAALIARHAELALALVRSRLKAAHLEVALHSNRTIGIAIGIIMDRRRITEQRALQTLVDASQRSHIKLRELAARVVESGELPRAGRLPEA